MTKSSDVDDFMSEAGLHSEEDKPKPEKKARRSLEGGTIKGEPNIQESDETRQKIRLVRTTLTITKDPKHRVAEFELTNRDGKLYLVTLDEPTARAMAKVFD